LAYCTFALFLLCSTYALKRDGGCGHLTMF
jgi:hypothetical protein